MFQNISKKLILSLVLWITLWIGIFISYAVDIIDFSQTINNWNTINTSWFNKVQNRFVNINDSWIYSWSINASQISTWWTASINITGTAATASSVPWTWIISLPSTIVGYGITDAPTKTWTWANWTWWIGITGNAATASGVPWTWLTGTIPNVSLFNNDVWYLTGASLADNRVNTTGDNITWNLNVSGNVGIGTTSPWYKLQIEWTMKSWNHIMNNTAPTIYLQDTDHRSAMIHTNSNYFYILRWDWTNSTSRATVLWRWPLTINLENNDATFWWNISATNFIDTDNSAYYINPSGNSYVGWNLGIHWFINQDNPFWTNIITAPIQVWVADTYPITAVWQSIKIDSSTSWATIALDSETGDNSANIVFYWDAINFGRYGNNFGGWIDTPFDFNLDTGLARTKWSWWVYSDIKLKENVKTLNNSLEKIQSLRWVSFDWKDTHNHTIWVIAQETEKILPEVVFTWNDWLKSVDYSKFTPVLIEAIKEQQKEIETLKKELKQLKADLVK